MEGTIDAFWGRQQRNGRYRDWVSLPVSFGVVVIGVATLGRLPKRSFKLLAVTSGMLSF